MRRFQLTPIVLVLALLACSNRPPLPNPARFDRLNRVEFVCVDTENSAVTVLEHCLLCVDLSAKGGKPNANNCRVDATDNRFSLFALVTQSARGEVAAINLQTRTVIDSRRDIPGYTYAPIGVFPSGIAVPKKAGARPTLTYVADFGSHDLRVLNTTSLVLPPTGPRAPIVNLRVGSALGQQQLGAVDISTQLWPPADTVELQVVPLTVETPEGPVTASPTELRLTPNEDALLVSLRDLGLILWVPLQQCPDRTDVNCHAGLIDVRHMVTIDLNGSADKIVPVVPSSEPRPAYGLTCDAKEPFKAPPPLPAAEPVAVPSDTQGVQPRPSALAFDLDCTPDEDPDCRKRLLVADEALPWIHAIDLDALAPGVSGDAALLPPIVVGTPTSDVVATPRVPILLDPTQHSGETRYVYAIDATDGSVLVTERGELLRPSLAPGGRPDRVTLGGAGSTQQSAMRLEVLTPTFAIGTGGPQFVKSGTAPTTTTTDDNICLDSVHTVQDPTRLRGVFLAVALSDGSVRFIDIHDREAYPGQSGDKYGDKDSPMPARTAACRQCPANPIPQIARHEARLAVNFATPDGATIPPSLAPDPNPLLFAVTSGVFPISPDGSVGTPDAPALCHLRCDSDLTQSFPTADQQASLPALSAENGCSSASSDKPPDALVCGVQNSWGAADELWSIVYNGLVPGTTTGATRLIMPGDPESLTGVAPELIVTAGETDFCAQGVLGREDVSADYPPCDGGAGAKDPLSGDHIIVSNEILGPERLRQLNEERASPLYKALGTTDKAIGARGGLLDRCQQAAQAIKDDPTLHLGFEIRQAYRGRLVLSGNPALANDKMLGIEDAYKCTGARPWAIEVHTLGSFSVVGSDSGFRHRVQPAANGRCVVDQSADPLQHARARLGCPYRNQTLQFELRELPGVAERLKSGVQLRLANQNPALKLSFNAARASFSTATIVPVELRYNDIDRRLYLVDISDRGLIPIPLDPLPGAVDSSSSFN